MTTAHALPSDTYRRLHDAAEQSADRYVAGMVAELDAIYPADRSDAATAEALLLHAAAILERHGVGRTEDIASVARCSQCECHVDAHHRDCREWGEMMRREA